MKKLILGSSLVLATLLFSGCSDTNQSGICVYSNDEEAEKCENGRLAFFKPNRWGNEQLPLVVVATYCDTNHQIIMNDSGVVCTFANRSEKDQKQK